MFTLILASHSLEADCPDLVIERFDTDDGLIEYLIERGDFGPDDVIEGLDVPGSVIPMAVMVGDIAVTYATIVVQA